MATCRGQSFLVCSLLLILSVLPLTAQSSSVTSDGYLRDWQYDGDHVAVSTENGNVRSVMTADEEKLVLRRYDERHRLISEVVWHEGYEKIASETDWTYVGKSVFPETMIKKNHEQNQLVKVLYSETGLEEERTTWTMSDGIEGSLLEKTEWQYDDKKRVICKMRENNAESANGSDGHRTEKTEYVYTEKSPNPDSSYYEDGILVESVEYIADGSYIERLFFEDMEIKATWVDGIKTEEVYYLDGVEVKRKTL